jgi:hypothetical protein
MDSQTIQTGGVSGPGVSAKIERNTKGYNWTLGASAVPQPGQSLDDAFEAAIDALARADGAMRRLFGPAPAGDLAEVA